jgi:hypothetical protein
MLTAALGKDWQQGVGESQRPVTRVGLTKDKTAKKGVIFIWMYM